MRTRTIIVLCISSLIVTAQTTFEKIIPLAGAQYLTSVIQMSDGGFAAMGQINSMKPDKWLVRTNATGDTLWTRTFPGTGYDYSGDRYFSETPDGGLTFLSGYFVPPYAASLTHVDASGNTVWKKDMFPGAGYVMSPVSGGYIIAGHESDSTSASDLDVFKVNYNGDLIWKRGYQVFPVSSHKWLTGRAIRETKDGGFIVAGNNDYGWMPSPLTYQFLFRIGPSGDSLWYREYPMSGDVYISSVDTTADGGFVACGSIKTGSSAYTMKVDAAGDTLWTSKNLYSPRGQYFYSVLSTPDGGAIACGETNDVYPGPDTTKVYMVKFSAGGTIEWERRISTLGSSSGYCIERTMDHGYIICGEVVSYDNSNMCGGLLIKTDANGNFTGTGDKDVLHGYKVFPNPAYDHVTVSIPEIKNVQQTITFYDLFGKEVSCRRILIGQTKVTIETGSWQSGLFLYVISDGSRNITGKICIFGNRH